MTGEERGDQVKASRASPDVEKEVLRRLPRWRRELLEIMERTKRDAATERAKAGDGR